MEGDYKKCRAKQSNAKIFLADFANEKIFPKDLSLLHFFVIAIFVSRGGKICGHVEGRGIRGEKFSSENYGFIDDHRMEAALINEREIPETPPSLDQTWNFFAPRNFPLLWHEWVRKEIKRSIRGSFFVIFTQSVTGEGEQEVNNLFELQRCKIFITGTKL